MNKMEKLIVVWGATGTIGKAVVYALLEDRSLSFKVRGTTSNVSGRTAQELAELGAEMVQASAEDMPSLGQAFDGAYGVFIITDYFRTKGQLTEVQIGKSLIDAAKASNVEHVVLAGSKPVQKLIGKPFPSLDNKAEIEEYLFASGLSATSLHLAMATGGIMNFLQKTKEGNIILNIPMEGKKLVTYPSKSLGVPVAAIFKNSEKFKGLTIGLASDNMTIQEYCDVINKLRGADALQISAGEMTAEEFAQQDFRGVEIFSALFEFYRSDHPSFDIEQTKVLDPGTMNFEDFMGENMSSLERRLKYL